MSANGSCRCLSQQYLGKTSSRGSKEVNVLFIPDYTLRNPYQRELATALAKRGVTVTMSNGVGKLPILGAIRLHGKPDVLHLHWTHRLLIGGGRAKSVMKSLWFVAELLIVKLLGVRIVWTVHNLLEHDDPRGPGHPEIELFFHRILVRLYDQLIVHSWFARDAAIRTYHLRGPLENKVNVIAHGHYIHSYKNEVGREQARRKLKLDEEAVVFLYFGQIRRYKGVFGLVDQFRKLEDPRVRLLIVGDPANDAERLKLAQHCQGDSRIKSRLQFIPDEEIQLYMNAADVVVLPFRDMLTSATVLLAMSFGRAIVAPRLGYIDEVLDEEGGFLYDPSDRHGLLKALSQALTADVAAMGQRNYAKAQCFDWDGIAEQTHEAYLMSPKDSRRLRCNRVRSNNSS